MKLVKRKLKELGEIVGGSTPSTKNPDFYDGNIPWITPKDLAGYTKMYISNGERSITEKGFKSCSTKMLPKNSILFSSRAPIGYIAIANNEMCTNQGFKSIIPNSSVDYMFLYYLLKNSKNYISTLGTGSTFKEVSGNVMKEIEVKIPEDIKEQKRISKILYSLDKKIEINDQINNNLYTIISNLFDEFLSQFDSNNLIKFEDVVKKIGTGADAIQRAPIVDYDTGIKCIRVGDLTNNRTPYNWGFTKMEDKDYENYKLDINDIVVSRTAVNGIPYIVEDDIKLVCNNGLIKLKVNEKYNPLFVYLILKTKDFYNYVHEIDNATSVRPNMKVNYLTSYKMKKVSLEEQNSFIEKIKPLRIKMKKIEKENHSLEQLRDTLLPKLMNGEIDLNKVEI